MTRRAPLGTAGTGDAAPALPAGAPVKTIAAYANPVEPALPPTDVAVRKGNTALVVTDPRIDFLFSDGVIWGVVGETVTEQGTGASIGRACP